MEGEEKRVGETTRRIGKEQGCEVIKVHRNDEERTDNETKNSLRTRKRRKSVSRIILSALHVM